MQKNKIFTSRINKVSHYRLKIRLSLIFKILFNIRCHEDEISKVDRL